MKLLLPSLVVTISWLALSAGVSQGESGAIQNRDNTSSRLSHLGDDIDIYSVPHGNHTFVRKPGVESLLGLRPYGETESGNRSAFDTPLPPNNLTPAPILPFHPNRALSPASPANSHTPSSGGSRFGR